MGGERAADAAPRAAPRAGRRRPRRRDHGPRAGARSRGLTSTVTFPRGNLAPEGSVIKSTAIDPTVVDADGVYRKTGPARVFTRETRRDRRDQGAGAAPVEAGRRARPDRAGGRWGRGWRRSTRSPPALKHLSFGKQSPSSTDARFSGVSTGACIGHVGPEALAGGPIGKVRDGDLIRIVVDRVNLEGLGRPRRRRRRRARRRGGRAAPAGRAAAPRPLARPRPARRHPALGGLAGGRRRDLGRVRLRPGRDHRGPERGGWPQDRLASGTRARPIAIRLARSFMIGADPVFVQELCRT